MESDTPNRGQVDGRTTDRAPWKSSSRCRFPILANLRDTSTDTVTRPAALGIPAARDWRDQVARAAAADVGRASEAKAIAQARMLPLPDLGGESVRGGGSRTASASSRGPAERRRRSDRRPAGNYGQRPHAPNGTPTMKRKSGSSGQASMWSRSSCSPRGTRA